MQVLAAVVGDNWFKRVNFELQALVLPGGTSSHSHSQASRNAAESSEGSATGAHSGTSSPSGQSQTRHPHNPEFPTWDGRSSLRDQSLHDPAAAIRWTEDQLRDKQRSLRSFETEFRQVMHAVGLALMCISPVRSPSTFHLFPCVMENGLRGFKWGMTCCLSLGHLAVVCSRRASHSCRFQRASQPNMTPMFGSVAVAVPLQQSLVIV